MAWRSIVMIVGYHFTLLLALMLRFREWPDYVRIHPWADNVWSVMTGFPSPAQALPVALREPWLEIGRSVPGLPLAQWSLQVIPFNLLVGALASLLFCRLWRKTNSLSRPVPVISAIGLMGIALTTSALTWLACCASPSWVVILAIMGMWPSTAMSLQPAGPALALAGFALLLTGMVIHDDIPAATKNIL
ncbi:MAG TPA: hypothetical protein HPQ04_04300 [Rhodospirillaceae bacterium]|nr:hypothetical protein [Rhodospirillaceae bacterium]